MACYLLHHRHQPDECGVVFASFKGHDSPLRHRATLASCRSGGHAIWWTVQADSEADALVEHALNVREARAAMFAQFAYDHEMAFYGEPSPRLIALVNKIGVDAEWFTFPGP